MTYQDTTDGAPDAGAVAPDFKSWEEAVPYGVACVQKRKRMFPPHALVTDQEVSSIVASALWEASTRGNPLTRAYVFTRAVGAFIDEVRKLSVGHRGGFLSRAKVRDLDDPEVTGCAELTVEPEQERHAEQRAQRALIELAIAGLDWRDRTIVEQVYLRDRSFADVALDLNCSSARISQLHARALRRVRDQLAAHGHLVPLPAPKAACPKPTPEQRQQRRQRVAALSRSGLSCDEIAVLEHTSRNTVTADLAAVGVEAVRRRPGRQAAPLPWHLRARALELHQQQRLDATEIARQLGIKARVARMLLGAEYVPLPHAERPRRRSAVATEPVVAKAESGVELPVAEVVVTPPVDLGAARVAACFDRFDQSLATVRRLISEERIASTHRVQLARVASLGTRMPVVAPPMANPPRLYLVPCTSAETTNAPSSELPAARCEKPVDLNLPQAIDRLEDEFIGKALTMTDGNKQRAAELLGLNRTTLVEMLKRKPRWRDAVGEPVQRRAASPERAPRAPAPKPPPADPIPRLEIVRLRADGLDPKAIAGKLGIGYWVVRKVLDTSPSTVAKA